MYCTLSRTQSDMSGISDWRKATLPLKPLEQQTVANFKVISCELISLSIVLYNSLEKSERNLLFDIFLLLDVFITFVSTFFRIIPSLQSFCRTSITGTSIEVLEWDANVYLIK